MDNVHSEFWIPHSEGKFTWKVKKDAKKFYEIFPRFVKSLNLEQKRRENSKNFNNLKKGFKKYIKVITHKNLLNFIDKWIIITFSIL